ncbi:MAG: hypothetical protein A2046_06905 [Bacteroidetes bacterium GWA2_30_7]|nr:MAG: hypothetical protein A2046_06905 [Bacteroidetes bacterium GWA2_30_7]
MNKVYYLLIFFVLFSVISCFSQTVIEMTHPIDAGLVLLEVGNSEEADIVIYKTNSKSESEEWDCKWKFKTWGFSNISVYLTQNPLDTLLMDPDTGMNIPFDGKIFFTDDITKRGYKSRDFRLEGVFRKLKLEDIQ